MFKGFSKEAVGFLKDIRIHNDKEWFEAHKQTYLDELFHPLKDLCTEVSEPFMKQPDMLARSGRIYADPTFPPYRKYRESMWLMIKHECWDWSKTPSLFFEISGEGAVYGLKLTHPAAAVMEKLRQRIVTDEGELMGQIKKLEKSGLTLGGEEYKRPKPCTVPEAERFFRLKSLMLTVTVSDTDPLLYSPDLADTLKKTFKKLFPLNELLNSFALEADAEKQALKQSALEPEMPKAPEAEPMW